MRALTLWQPWASSIVHGPKRVENRPWAPPASLMGKRFLIHAGKHYDKSAVTLLNAHWPEFRDCETMSFPSGVILGRARLVGCLRKGQSEFDFEELSEIEERHRDDPFFFGPFGWILEDVEAFAIPIECRGFQMLWTPAPEILERVPQ